MKAILIDGVGRTRHMQIDSVMPYFQLPRRREVAVSFDAAPPMYVPNGHHRFNLLFNCKTFCVFGFEFEKGPQYQLLHSKAEWSHWMSGDQVEFVWDDQDNQIARFAKEAYGPVYPVVEFIRPDMVAGTTSRLCMLVARKP